jgi:hypothetical protein
MLSSKEGRLRLRLLTGSAAVMGQTGAAQEPVSLVLPAAVLAAS